MKDLNEMIKEVLTKYKKIAVVGLSSDPGRPSYGVSAYMQVQGYKITPIKPPGGEMILNEKSVASLSALPSGEIEIVDVFRKPEAVPEIVDEAIRCKAKVLWLQEGVAHPVAEEKARQAGMIVISDRCILKEHRRLL